MASQFIRFDDVAPFTLVDGRRGPTAVRRRSDGQPDRVRSRCDGSATQPPPRAARDRAAGHAGARRRRRRPGARPDGGLRAARKVEHSAYCGPEGATVIDVFCPVTGGLSGEMGRFLRRRRVAEEPSTRRRSGRFPRGSTSHETSSRHTPPTRLRPALTFVDAGRRHRSAHVRRTIATEAEPVGGAPPRTRSRCPANGCSS